MEQQIFLEKNRSKYAVNVENRVNLDLSTKTRMLPIHSVSGDFSLLEQYNAERDACDKFRMIFTVNPICSNVLFNMQTEVVQWEGSASANVITLQGIANIVAASEAAWIGGVRSASP